MEGVAALSACGLMIDPASAQPRSATTGGRAGRALYDCVDWSERRDHFAGSTAAALLEAFVAQGWLKQSTGSRELAVTRSGQTDLVEGLLAC